MTEPSVFISYSHDSPEHKDAVLALSDRLRREGVDCIIDQYEQSPEEGWPLWCERQVERAGFVLVVCTETYLRRFRGEEARGKGLGGTWEGHNITQELYNAQGRNSKFIPVTLRPEARDSIPLILQSATRYRLNEDYEWLYRRLTGQPALLKLAVGGKKPLAARQLLQPGRKLKEAPKQILTVFDVFLSHSHKDADFVERLGIKLKNKAPINIWLDKWVLVPGEQWQQDMTKGLNQARTCAVCLGKETPTGWFRQEIEKALNRQVKDPTFRVIPVLLPDGNQSIVDDFLELRTWVDFKSGIEDGNAIHMLMCGIRGEPPGSYVSYHDTSNPALEALRGKLMKIRNLREEKLIDDKVAVDYQRRVLDEIVRF